MADTVSFVYNFSFPDGKRTRFSINLQQNTLTLIPEPMQEYPEWTRLGFGKCSNCLLDERFEPLCPVAVALVHPVEVFRDSLSYENAEVSVESPERSYSKVTTLQHALSSLVGLLMATSGCPNLERLKPMGRFHLPFASSDETAYRVLGTYLLAQYIRLKRGSDPDWDMKHLESLYDTIRTVNKHVVARLRHIPGLSDASLNALIGLDCFAINIKLSIDLGAISTIEEMFGAYM